MRKSRRKRDVKLVWQKSTNIRFRRKGVNIRFDEAYELKEKGCDYINSHFVFRCTIDLKMKLVTLVSMFHFKFSIKLR